MRIYGKAKQIADGYFEVEYKEYREDGTLRMTGTEDFSLARWAEVPTRFIFTWDGEKRNKGGNRWFDFEGTVRTSDPKALRKIATKLYKADTVEVRTR